MAYSRWSNSVWYTYWAGSNATSMEDELFQICDLRGNINFTYGEIVEQLKEGRLEQHVKDEIIFELMTTPEVIIDPSDIFLRTLSNDLPIHKTRPPLSEEDAMGAYTEEEYEELVGYMKEFKKDVEIRYLKT